MQVLCLFSNENFNIRLLGLTQKKRYILVVKRGINLKNKKPREGDFMNKEIIYSKNAPEPVGPYSQAIKINGPINGMMYCSGMIPINPATSEVLKGTVTEQAELIFSNIEAFLKDADLKLSNVVKTMVFLTDMSKFAEFNEVYSKYFGEGKPARSCVEVSGLPKGVDVEVEVIAVL